MENHNGIYYRDHDVLYYDDQIKFKKQLSSELGYQYTGEWKNRKKELPFYFDGSSLVGHWDGRTQYGDLLCGDYTYIQIKVLIILIMLVYENSIKKEGFIVLNKSSHWRRDFISFLFGNFIDDRILKRFFELCYLRKGIWRKLKK